jgi:predicted homoserine dehydrogenase-like protein
MIFAPYDVALGKRQSENRPIQVGLIGAGNLARMISVQLVNPPPPGIRLAAIANRTPSRAAALLNELGLPAKEVSSAAELSDAIVAGRLVCAGDPNILTQCDHIDVIVEATGSVDFALTVTLNAIAHRKHVVLANAELDSTLGPALKARADRAGVVYTNIDGDEPGVAMNLVRYARSIGLRPVAAGNLKGMVDPYRNPDTQKKFAEEHGQNASIVTSFADGTKLAMELCILANATGFKVGRPGMYGPACKSVNEIAALLPAEQMLSTGLVDYALGAAPYTGAFVVTHEPVEIRRKFLRYLKMGDGPFYVLYTPYHLPHIQMVSTIARAVETGDSTVAPLAAPSCQVIACAKKDLPAGAVLDGPGGFTCYGRIENFAPRPRETQGFPIALTNGCTLNRAIKRDEPIMLPDVKPADASPAYELWMEMLTTAAATPAPSSL